MGQDLTRGKDVGVVIYVAEEKRFTATAGQVDFSMNSTIVETDPEYTRVYVDGVEVPSASIDLSMNTVTIPAVDLGSEVYILTPKTKNPRYRFAQSIQFDAKTGTQDIPELDTEATTSILLNTTTRLTASWAQDSQHNLMSMLLENKVADNYLVIAEKFKNTTPDSFRIFKEVKVGDITHGVNAGGVAMEQVTFVCKWPMVILKT